MPSFIFFVLEGRLRLNGTPIGSRKAFLMRDFLNVVVSNTYIVLSILENYLSVQ